MTSQLNLDVPEYIRSMIPYVPGKPIEETQREFHLKEVIKIASNENPLGPSPKAVAQLRSCLKELHRYPDGSGHRLKNALAKQLRVDTPSIILGNGSNELIDLIIRTFCVPGDAIVTSKAAFIAYRLCAQISGVESLETELREDLTFDLPAMAELVRQNKRVKVVFVANPNNPTGTYSKSEELRRFLSDIASLSGQDSRRSIVVALDYAYWEYVTAKDMPDPMELMREFPNVIVLRTFSKIYGLAGLRLGYGVGNPEMVQILEKVRQPFHVNSMALAGGEAALSDKAFVARARKINIQGMKFWEQNLTRLGIPFWKSQGNFILVDTQQGMGKSGSEVFQACLRRGVIFRPVANYGLAHALRISIGTPAENSRALKALEAEMPNRQEGLEPPKAKAGSKGKKSQGRTRGGKR